MSRRLPATDVAIIGLGWTGAIMAEQLTKAGLNVIARSMAQHFDRFSDHLHTG